MKRLAGLVLATVVAFSTQSTVGAQSKTITGDEVTIKATVEAIDAVTRTLTVKDSLGNYHPIIAPDSMTRFAEVKVGDMISARYYDNVVIRVKAPGEPAVNSSAAAVTPATNVGGTKAKQRTITATIVAVDMNMPSITFKGENINWNYSSRVADKESLAKVKAGDRVDITWTEAVVVSILPPTK